MIEFIVTQDPGRAPVTVLNVKGELDIASADRLEKCAQELIVAGTQHLVINLAGVSSLKRCGIVAIDQIMSYLLAGQSRLEWEAMHQGIRAGTFKSSLLKLANPSKYARQELHMAGVDMYLEIHHDLNQAIASFDVGVWREEKESNKTLRAQTGRGPVPNRSCETVQSA